MYNSSKIYDVTVNDTLILDLLTSDSEKGIKLGPRELDFMRMFDDS